MAVSPESVVLRFAKDFPTEKALRQYLKDHPDANKAKHTVEGNPPGKKAPTGPGPSKPPPIPDAAKKGPSKPPPIPDAAKKKQPPAVPGDAKKTSQPPPIPDAAKKPPQKPPAGQPGDQGEAKPEAPQSPEQGRLDAWKGKFKNLSDNARQFVEQAPKSVKHFVGNSEFRGQTMKAAKESILASPGKFKKNLIETVKHEKHEFKLATKGIGKVLSGKKMNKHEQEAFKAIATHMAITAAATAAMATGPLGGAAIFAKSLATHIAAKAAGRSLENAHTLYEFEHIGHGVLHLLKHIAAEDDKKGKRSPEDAMAELVLASVIKEFENLSDDDIAQALESMGQEEEPEKKPGGKDKTAMAFRVAQRYAGDVVPLQPRKQPRVPQVTIAGTKYNLSTDSGPVAGDLDERFEGEHPEHGPRVIRMPSRTGNWKYLWVYDTDKQYVTMWRAHDGNEKLYQSARSMTSQLIKLDKKGQLNRVGHNEYRVIDKAMRKVEDEHNKALAKWVEESKDNFQREVDQELQRFFKRVIEPQIKRAMDEIDQGVEPFGFRPQDIPRPVEEQKKIFAIGRILDREFTVDQMEEHLRLRGVDIDNPNHDLQATYWAVNEIRDAVYDRFRI